jgi:hypothetical protein
MNNAGEKLVFDGKEESMRDGLVEGLEKLSRVNMDHTGTEVTGRSFLTVGRGGLVKITAEEVAGVAGEED